MIGDVLAVRRSGPMGRLIRLGAALRDHANLSNHVVVVHHQDEAGRWWGIEGRPGGVGWVTLDRYLADPRTVSNAAQPRTDAHRKAIADTLRAALGTPYDWGAILSDALGDVFLPASLVGPQVLLERWWRWGDGAAPGHVVCSSLAAWVYEKVGLAHPDTGEERVCQPYEWWEFNTYRKWVS